jgi:signal transduction histidine kinase
VQVVTEGTGPLIVIGDTVQLRRAISNVLDNAVRAAGRCGSVQITVGRKGALAFVYVLDDGPGFGRGARGLGEGLSIVSSVIHRYRGRLEIMSGPGAGTEVRMYFPLAGAVIEGVAGCW